MCVWLINAHSLPLFKDALKPVKVDPRLTEMSVALNDTNIYQPCVTEVLEEVEVVARCGQLRRPWASTVRRPCQHTVTRLDVPPPAVSSGEARPLTNP